MKTAYSILNGKIVGFRTTDSDDLAEGECFLPENDPMVIQYHDGELPHDPKRKSLLRLFGIG